jgi:endonuclease YncB( thermonuclease family)
VGETYQITTRERGKFGRYLATICLSKRRTINDLLVKSLLAVPYHGQNKKEIQAAHEKNRKELVKQGLL